MNISVLSVKSQLIDGKQVCIEANILFSLVDGETGLKYRLAEEVKLDEPSDDQFIDYDSVTEENVIKWVVDKLTEQKIDANSDVSRYENIRTSLEAGLAKMIESKQITIGLPWEGGSEESNIADEESKTTTQAEDTTDS